MSETRVPAGVPTGGQFTATARPESAMDPLVPNAAGAEVLSLYREAGRLCARETAHGHVLPGVSYAEVAFEMRAALLHLEDAEFDQHMGRIARAAGFVSLAEVAESTDTRAYEAAAQEAEIEEEDHPLSVEDRDPDGDYLDCDAYRAAVIEHWDAEIFAAVETMVAADHAAAHGVPVDSGARGASRAPSRGPGLVRSA